MDIKWEGNLGGDGGKSITSMFYEQKLKLKKSVETKKTNHVKNLVETYSQYIASPFTVYIYN